MGYYQHEEQPIQEFRGENVSVIPCASNLILMRLLKSGKDKIAARFSAPFLSRMITSNSWSKRIHRISLGLASFLVKRYFIAEARKASAPQEEENHYPEEDETVGEDVETIGSE
ncbi:hypothetical protein Tco_0684650 [Tanacetum coccineum]